MNELVFRLVGWGDERLPLGLRLWGWRSCWVTTSRGRLHYFDVRGHGTGPPMVLIHGLGSRGADYALLVRRLRRFTRRIIVPDLPGHGWSPNDAPGPDDMRAILVEAIDDLLPEPAYLVGNSMGGLVAVRLALHAPERVRALLLLSPAGAPLEEHQIAAIRSYFTLSTLTEANRFLDRLLAAKSRLRMLMALGLPARLRRPAVRNILENIRNDDLLTVDEVRSLSMPLFLFWGAADQILDGDQLAWYRRALPEHAVVVTPDGFGHSPFFDQPGLFVREVRAFLEAVEGREG